VSTRTPVAGARLTLVLPPALRAKTASTGRVPKYVNPLGANFIEVYVDDALALSTPVSNANGDGTLALSIPLYSTSNNTIVAVEWESTRSDVLAIGETNQGAITPGTNTAASLTMQMQAYYVGIVALPNGNNAAPYDPEILGNQSYYASASGTPANAMNDGQFICSNSPTSNGFALYPADATQTLVPIAGYGGTMPATITSVSSTGTSHIAQSPLGTYYAVFDAQCSPITITATSPNPVYPIYVDVVGPTTGNHVYSDTYFEGAVGGYVAGPNQGIFNMYLSLHVGAPLGLQFCYCYGNGPNNLAFTPFSIPLAGPWDGGGSVTIVGSPGGV
jgi:hypothetical protein